MTDTNTFPSRAELTDYLKKMLPERGYKHIETYLEKLENLPSPLKEEFAHWWHTGELDSKPEVHGVTVGYVMEKKKWNALDAFVAFAELYLNPDDENELKFLKYNFGIFP